MKCVRGTFIIEGKNDEPKIFPTVRINIKYRDREKNAIFVIDTGATITMINYYDAELLGFYEKDVAMNSIKIKKAGGRVDSEYVLKNPVTFEFLGKN